MILKIIIFVATVIPFFLFVRSVFFQRTRRINQGLNDLKQRADSAVSILLFLIGCFVLFAVGRLVWTWWM
jgi:hypothetical protein